MSSANINLTWLRSFEVAARTLNFTRAAEELSLTQTAISLHIRSLESVLGCQLFTRRARNLTLTDIGEAYVMGIRPSLKNINQATTALFGITNRQTITLRVPISTATLWLAPLLGEFIRDFPHIHFRMVSSIWADAITNDDVDIDLRLGNGDWPDVKAEKISEEFLIPVCRTDRLNEIPCPEDLLDKNLIHILGYEDQWHQYFEANHLKLDHDHMQYSVDTTVAAIQLVAAGAGFATVLQRFAKAAKRNEMPITEIGEPIPFQQAHYIVESIDSTTQSPEVDIFKAWLKDCFRDY